MHYDRNRRGFRVKIAIVNKPLLDIYDVRGSSGIEVIVTTLSDTLVGSVIGAESPTGWNAG